MNVSENYYNSESEPPAIYNIQFDNHNDESAPEIDRSKKQEFSPESFDFIDEYARAVKSLRYFNV